MKVKHYFLLFGGIMLMSVSVYGQTEAERLNMQSKYDLEKAKQFQIEIEAEQKREYEEAVRLAELNNWPITYFTEEGNQVDLIRVVDGKRPVYYTITNKNAAITARVDKVNTGGGAGLDLNGEDMLVGVWDENKCRTTHQLFEGRVTTIDGATTNSNHSTHVTGTVIGSGAFQSGNAQGMAPAAEVLSHDWNTDISEANQAIMNHGMLVSNHSYGYAIQFVEQWMLGKYDGSARNWDLLHFNNPYYVAVKAAGNDRGAMNHGDNGFDMLTGSCNSKNNIVVAGTAQVLNYTGPNSVTIYSASSWGPTDDGRVKPDIAAKAINTFSSTAASDASYSSFTGTSMASPSVAGAIILLQQHYNDLNSEFMRSASLKGLVIHTADETGLHPGPDYRFGWGLINTERAAEVISNDGDTAHIMELLLTEGETIQFSGAAVAGQRVVATICWTDKAGTVLPGEVEDQDDPRLINDLDLRVIDGSSTTFEPWILDHNNFPAAATNGDNYRDNVEKIEIDPASGNYTFRITHKGNLDGGEQAVSLIISGVEDIVVGTQDNDLVAASVYPNPATDELNIIAQNQISDVEVFNILGQSLFLQSVAANSTTLNISSLQAGTYFAKVTVEGNSQVYKFIKK